MPVPPARVVATLENGTLVKERIPRMRACDQRNDKGKACQGHLKRYFDFTPEVIQKFGKNAEIYRCERCKTLYLPNPNEQPRTGTLSW